ncbi:glutathione S-transferase [Alishewanella longhuensis]|uniref:Glutathione S-transferase n=1 Tax=Alishewanella longhuensis TaxID=1091037 RepID=A0ABQ3KVI0_9ALTE|nr:MAPEG family protein [Alishewanella longhuensis]GHG60145.1 glutathione S-transferase [Alishewanella longhuensis]
MITGIYAALLALLFIILSLAVITKRRQLQVALGSGGHSALERAIRVHANFAEYTPIALILLFLAETNGLAAPWLHVLGSMLVLGRLSHAYGVSQTKEPLQFRVWGMLLTFGVLTLSALAILVLVLVRSVY